MLTDDLSDQERVLLELTATPAATLLGAVSMSLRTTLFSEDPVAWVDMWQARPDLARMFDWLDREGYRADLPALRRRRPDLVGLESWLRANWTVPPAASD